MQNPQEDPLQPIPPQEKQDQPANGQSTAAGATEDDPTQQPQEPKTVDRDAPDDSDLSRREKDGIRYSEERPPTEDSML